MNTCNISRFPWQILNIRIELCYNDGNCSSSTHCNNLQYSKLIVSSHGVPCVPNISDWYSTWNEPLSIIFWLSTISPWRAAGWPSSSSMPTRYHRYSQSTSENALRSTPWRQSKSGVGANMASTGPSSTFWCFTVTCLSARLLCTALAHKLYRMKWFKPPTGTSYFRSHKDVQKQCARHSYALFRQFCKNRKWLSAYIEGVGSQDNMKPSTRFKFDGPIY